MVSVDTKLKKDGGITIPSANVHIENVYIINESPSTPIEKVKVMTGLKGLVKVAVTALRALLIGRD